MKETEEEIDFVITWVDGNDPTWQTERARYRAEDRETELAAWNDAPSRYRDWDLLRFWFRGVEKFAPWVRKVHFVTCGQIPDWLDTSNPKLSIVNHKDFIPKEYLPTFSSHTIELNLHRIKDLAEHFVYFNDDMYLTKTVEPKDFFIHGLPCDTAVLLPVTMEQNGIRAEINDLYAINRNFEKRRVIRQKPRNWFSPKYSRLLLRTFCMMPFRLFSGFYITHLPNSYCKTTFEKVWQKETKILEQTCRHRFRTSTDVNQWLMEYWQLCENRFYPRSQNVGRLYEGETQLKEVPTVVRQKKYKMICINDSQDLTDFEQTKKSIAEAFAEILAEKCSYER